MIPSIGIDTRWGVPRYDPAKETETYAMNGEMLTPMAHRGELRDRYPSGKRFYSRAEGACSRIIRKGDNPEGYWWEVTDKSGTRYFYGGTSLGFDPQSVLRTDEENDGGHIAQWMLSEVRDLNGNTVRYYYDKVSDEATVPGYQIYISRVTYTGTPGGDGKYEVLFKRDRQLEETLRTDVSVMANLGFKQTTADLLRKIEVKFDGDPVRHYELSYQPGEFSKTLLAGITDFDADGNKFTEHMFEYYNDVRNGDQFKPLDPGAEWASPDDGINGNFKTSVGGFGDHATALSGTRSKDRNVGVTVSVGIGVMVWSKQASAGVSGGYSKSQTEGLLVMMDMNGDGLQDKVFVKNNQLHYRPNLSNQENPGFAIEAIPIHGDAADAFFREKSRTTSFGAEASFGIFAGYSRSNTTSKTTTYFADVNGDQLPDIVKNGVVYFNHLDPETGEIEYVASSDGTPNPIFSSGAIADGLYDRDALEQERQLAIDQNPLIDIVRMWKAPYGGKIKVTAPVQLLRSGNPQRAEEPADGVRVAIQLQNTPVWDDIIEADDDQPHEPTGTDELTVNRGDMLFFRVGSRDNGSYDSVRWNPTIEYLDKDEELLDPNGRLVYTFSAGDDYVVSSDQNVVPPINGTVKITGEFRKPVTTDDLELFIFKEDHERNIIDTVWHRAYRWDEEAVSFPDFDLQVTDQDSYTFKVVASSNIDWNSIVWRPKLVYVSADNPDIELSKSVIEVSPTAEYWLYVNALHNAEPFLVELDSAGQRDTVSVDPELAFLPRVFFEPAYTGDITFTAKKLDTLLAKQVLRVQDGKIVSDSILSVPVVHGDKVFFEFHARDAYLVQRLGLYDVAFSVQEQDTTLQGGLHTVMPETADREDVIFGTLYRGWGHFGWNGNREKATQPINVGLLKLSEELKEKGKKEINVDSGEDLQNEDIYDAKNDPFFLLVASAADQHWISGDQNAWLSGEVIHSSRLGDDDLSIIEPGTGGRGIDKVSKSKGNAYSLGAVAVGLTKSDANSHVLTDFMDMNGDRYPDIVSEKIIQYTNARGGLSDKTIPSLGFVQETEASTRAYSLSGSFPMPMPKFRTGVKTFKQSQVDGGDAASLSGSVSVNVSAATGENEANYSWLDFNGDGLPDRVNLADGKVMLNLGYGFTTPETWNFGQIQKGESNTESGGAGLGFTKGNNSISAGFSLARSDNSSNEMLMDINGDGLPDKVRKGNPVEVWINTGHGFETTPLKWHGATAISENATASESANASFTVGFTLFGVKWTVTPSVSGGNAMSRDLTRFTDMNGDGYPDLVTSEVESDLDVSLSTIGRTNMLKTVHRPLGASFTMDYARVGNTYEMPHSQWVLDRVEVFDGYAGDGVDSLLTTYAYQNGYHDRFERDFFGFEKVITRSHDTEKDGAPVYTRVTKTFNNNDYFMKGLLLSEVMTDGDGKKFIARANQFKLKDVREGVKYPCLEMTRQEFFEGRDDPGKTTQTHFVYDSLGNVITFTDKGDVDAEEDDLVADITYHNVDELYLKGSPESITVNGDGRVYRRRESEIDATGERDTDPAIPG